MSRFIYVVAEGVLDVTFLEGVLKRGFGLPGLDSKEELPLPAQAWLKNFGYPHGGNIRRLAVPAPVFVGNAQILVALRNAEGLPNIERHIEADFVAFEKEVWRPEAAAIILDSDKEPPAQRLSEFAALLVKQGYPSAVVLNDVTARGAERSGVFSFPGDGADGTLEDVLLPLGARAFPNLYADAGAFIEAWRAREDATRPPHDQLAKPAGFKKAHVSAMSALLKPAKPIGATLQDHDWIPEPASAAPVLAPLLRFLADLLGVERLAQS